MLALAIWPCVYVIWADMVKYFPYRPYKKCIDGETANANFFQLLSTLEPELELRTLIVDRFNMAAKGDCRSALLKDDYLCTQL